VRVLRTTRWTPTLRTGASGAIAHHRTIHGDGRHQREDLAEKLEVRGKDLIASLLMRGVFVTVNQVASTPSL